MFCGIIFFVLISYADVAELADAPDLGSGVYDVGVQVPSSAPNFVRGTKHSSAHILFITNPNHTSPAARILWKGLSATKQSTGLFCLRLVFIRTKFCAWNKTQFRAHFIYY